MKAYEIALFLFITMALLSFFQETLDTEGKMLVPAWTDDNVSDLIRNPESDGILSFITNIPGAIVTFLVIIFKSTIFVPVLLDELGLPIQINAIISGVAYIIYAVAVFQIITSRNVAGAE